MYHEKGLEKIYSIVTFLETLTETITIKNLEQTLKLSMSFRNFHDILYIVENQKVLKKFNQWLYSGKHCLKLLRSKT